MRFALLLSTFILFTACSGGEEDASVAEVQNSGVTVHEVWARNSRPPHANSAAFLQIENSGSRPVQILSASTPRAGITELHSMEFVDDKMKMRRVDSFSIAPHETFLLQPGGNHLMFFELDEPWLEGQVIPITLVMSEGKPLELLATVKVQ
ncbi:MAG: copper chaperone PCu(A)C [Planctomycetota bacterium]|nr:copper chaperone PCu(A)C [Planctomycetota bacterium]MDA1113468.1 copper chaperone PCu(A)C [Planctomycetota bacterium]